MLQCDIQTAGVTTLAMAKRFRRQAATCATLAKQSHDEGDRQRYRRLEQTYLELAEAEERDVRPAGAFAADSNIKPAA
jgi:hypothetical protein